MTRSKKPRCVLFLPFYFVPEYHAGIAQYAGEHGWNLNADMVWTRQIPYGWQGDGVITLLTADKKAAAYIRSLKVPVVDMGIMRPDLQLIRVCKDNVQTGIHCARHFLEQGWHHFAFFSRAHNNVCDQRLKGFREELNRHGHDCAELILPKIMGDKINRWDILNRYLKNYLKRLEKPLAVMAFSDYDASLLINVALYSGLRVPADVGVIGTENFQQVCTTLPVTLSSVNPDTYSIGYRAASVLDRIMAGGKPPRSPILMPPRNIIQRQSTNHLVIRDPRLAKGIEMILQNLNRPFSLDQVARFAGISRNTLYLFFQRELKQYPADFIRNRRLAMAQTMLMEKDTKIANIAVQCGFPLSTFMRLFQSKFGQSPQAWRRAMIGEYRPRQ